MIIRKQLDGDENTDLGQQVTKYRRTCPYRYHYAVKFITGQQKTRK